MKALAEQIKVMQACLDGKPIECKYYQNDSDECFAAGRLFDWLNEDYRVKEVPVTKPPINWDHVHPDFKWIATDKDGQTYLYSEKPVIRFDSCWNIHVCGMSVDARHFQSLVPGTCDWRDSLVERPKGD